MCRAVYAKYQECSAEPSCRRTGASTASARAVTRWISGETSDRRSKTTSNWKANRPATNVCSTVMTKSWLSRTSSITGIDRGSYLDAIFRTPRKLACLSWASVFRSDIHRISSDVLSLIRTNKSNSSDLSSQLQFAYQDKSKEKMFQ